jgi:hypothetical protein
LFVPLQNKNHNFLKVSIENIPGMRIIEGHDRNEQKVFLQL